MKLLRLGSSQDAPGRVPGQFSLNNLIQEGLSRELGEPIEVITKPAWPNARMPEMVRRWMDEYEPDMVAMRTVGYWFMYESVPIKLRRRFGRVGKKIGDAGHNASDVPWLAFNPGFRLGRRIATRLIGGETNFTPDEVVNTLQACIKEVVRHEGTILYVNGPGGRSRHGDYSKQGIARMEARRQYVTRRMAEVCAQHRVTFIPHEVPMYELGTVPPRGKDALHYDVEGNLVEAARNIAELAAEIRRVRGETSK
ncbi:MAG: hypothetical protein ACKVVT_18025 [Dehalococcoidia bacterium]